MAQATPDSERVVRAHAEMWREQDYSKIPEVVSESYVEYNPVVPDGEIRGADGLEEWMREITSAFPDLQGKIVDLVADGETVMTELEFTMTHEGEFDGIPPTGREVEFPAMGKFLVEDGKVRESRFCFDSREIFEQLGVAEE